MATAESDHYSNLNLHGNEIKSVADPTAAQSAATKNYVDTADALKYDAANVVNGGDVAFTGTVTWTGTTAPSGTENHRIVVHKVGKLVFFCIRLNYTVAGAALTNVTLTNLTQLPDPIIFTGWSAASNLLFRFLGHANTLRTAAGTNVGHAIWFRRDAAATANELGGTAFASGAYRYYEVIGTYVAA